MNDYEKLEYIHSILDQISGGYEEARPPCCRQMLDKSQQFVEEIREKHPQAPWNKNKRRLTK